MNSQPLKAANAKTLRSKVLETYPYLEDHIDKLWPKKAKVMQLKIKGEAYATFIKIDETICFLELRGKAIIPML